MSQGRFTPPDGALLFAERDHRIDARRPYGGNRAGREGNESQKRGDGRESSWIVRRDTVEQARQRAAHKKSSTDARAYTRECHRHLFADHEAQNTDLASAKSHPQSDFPGPAAD